MRNLCFVVTCVLLTCTIRSWVDDDAIITNRDFIEMVWYAYVEHGYISEDSDTMGQFVDTLHIVM